MANSFLDGNGVSHLWEKIKGKFVQKETGKGLSTNDYTTAEKNKLGGIEAGANKYVHPSGTAKSSGLYKITVNSTGHVSAASAVAKSDITGLGIPGQDTTYDRFTGAGAQGAGASGLVPAPAQGEQSKVLCGGGTWEAPSMSFAVVNYETAAVKFSLAGAEVSALIPVADMNKMGLMTDLMYRKLSELPAGDVMEATYAKKSDITNMYRYKGSVPAASGLPTTGQTAGDVYNIVASSSYGPAGTNVAWTGTAWDALGGLLEISAITNAEIDSICV